MDKKYRIIILGAGFSRPAGFPLASELWKEIRETAAAYPKNLRASKFVDDLDHYIEFRRDTEGEALTPETVNFEDFMRFLDVEHYLGLRGAETWSPDGNEGTIVTKYLIGKILARHISGLSKVPDLYIEFAKRLDLDDIVITFNYDTLLECALDAIGKPYRLFTTRFDRVDEFGGGRVDDTRAEVVILKVHGSIDWFDRAGFERQIAIHQKLKAPPPSHIVFSDEAVGLERLVDGPRPQEDPLQFIYHVKNLKALYEKNLLFTATPKILAPSSAKLLYMNAANDFWHGMGTAGLSNFGLAIVGFSLPTQDEYARQIIYEFVTNYQRYKWDEENFGLRKTPLAIIDFLPSQQVEDSFRNRYRFVDWTKAELIGSGFDFPSLDKIFA